MRSLNDSVITMSSKDIVVTHLSFLIDTMIRIGTHTTAECALVCLYHISYNASANQKKNFSHNKGQRHKDGLQMVCPATLFCSIFFVGPFCCCNTAKTTDGEKRKAYIHPVSDEGYDTLLLLVQRRFEVRVNRWKYLQTSKPWRLQKAAISSGQQLCRFKRREDS